MEQDHYLYATQTVGRKLEDPAPFIKKETFYINDQQNGNYNGQISFDTSSLQGSNKWVAWNEGYVVIPFVVTLQSSRDQTADAHAFMMGLKAGTHHIVDSVTVDWNGTQVVQAQPYTNFLVHYQMMASYSQDDVKKWGSQNLFIPDNAQSISYKGAGVVPDGRYFSNNRINKISDNAIVNGSTLATTTVNVNRPEVSNQGYFERLKVTGYNPAAVKNALVNTAALAKNAGLNYYASNGAGAANEVYYLAINAVIRLKDLTGVNGWFDNIPVCRGGWLRLTINYNAARVVIAKTGDATAAADPKTHTLAITSSTMLTQGNTVPFMFSSMATTNTLTDAKMVAAVFANMEPNYYIANDANNTNYTLECGVGRSSTVSGVNAFTNCRLYLNQYIMDPVLEDSLRSAGVERSFGYNDFYNQNITEVASGQTTNTLLSNGIKNAKYIVVIPFVKSSSLGNISEFQSPFSTAPATTSPYASLTGFNIQIGGSNVFQENYDYDFQTYENEVAPLLAVDGGSATGSTSGLLTQAQWSAGYRYYVVDLARRMKSEDPIPKSIQLLAKNNTALPLTLYCFIVYEKRVTLNLLTSQITQILM